jgi:ribonuclease VapC
MIVDSSAIVSIVKAEVDAFTMAQAIANAFVARMSAASYFEASIVVDGYRKPELSAKFDRLLEESGIVIEPVTPEQAQIARQAYRDYGRGSGHKANLNFGDCFTYALARDKREPVLFKGNDFIHTDLRPS